NFDLLDTVVQRLWRAADLRSDRHDRLPPGGVLTLVIEHQPHSALAHFRGKLVRGLAHDAPSYSRVGASGKPGAVHIATAGVLNLFNAAPQNSISLRRLRHQSTQIE